jgi:AAA15 family ATPase/GTPase
MPEDTHERVRLPNAPVKNRLTGDGIRMKNAIASIEIKDFLVFKYGFTADFCPGVNVLIGGNGSGKTTLMKAMYGVCDNSNPKFAGKPIGPNRLNRWNSLLPYFSTDYAHLENLCGPPSSIPNHKKCLITYNDTSFGYRYPTVAEIKQSEGLSEAEIGARSDFTWHYFGGFETMSGESDAPYIQSVFIPADEMLSHAKGLLALNNQLAIPFDQTLIDILSKAELPETREITANAAKVLDKIKNIIGGEVVYENDMFFVVKEHIGKVPFSLEASGFRRLGLLWKLLRNGLLEAGSILFWDEPENSLNPKLVPELVGILLALQRNGVQIFIATHSYDLARWFDLNKREGDSLRFFNLTNTGNGVEEVHADDYVSLPYSVIDEADSKMLRRVAEVAAAKAGVTLK